MKKLLLLCGFLLLGAATNHSHAQLYCTNQTNAPVWIAIAYNYIDWTPGMGDVKDTWVTESWLYIEPGDSAVLSSHMGYDRELGSKTNFFYHAFQDVPGGRTWEGIRKFMLDTTPPNPRKKGEFDLRISRAHKEAIRAKNPSYKWHLFKAGTLGTKQSHIIVLRQNDINDTIGGVDDISRDTKKYHETRSVVPEEK